MPSTMARSRNDQKMTMAFENMFPKASVAPGNGPLPIKAAYPVQAKTRNITGSLALESAAPNSSTAELVVRHGVRVRAPKDIIKHTPKSFVYVTVSSLRNTSQECGGRNATLINQRVRAVTSDFEQREISAEILILLGSGRASHTSEQSDDGAQSLKQHFKVVQLDLASGLD
jgi:hypothetical protein